MLKILIIANPVSGNYNKKKIEKVRDILLKKADIVDIKLTEYKAHAVEIASQADYHLVIAAGGDGLLNEVARGLINTNKLFSALPFGTANVFCNEYKINKNPIKAAERLNIRNIRKIPVGYVDSHLFLMMTGFGFDAKVVKKVEEKKHYFKKLAHILKGFGAIFSDYDKFYIYNNGKKEKHYHAIFSIIASYAGSYKLGKIKPNTINLFGIRDDDKSKLLKGFVSLFLGFGFKGDRLFSNYFKVTGASYCQIDGDLYLLNNDSCYISIKENGLNFIK